MKIESYRHDDGERRHSIINMTDSELCYMLLMINGAGLVERREFNGVKQQIEKLIKQNRL